MHACHGRMRLKRRMQSDNQIMYMHVQHNLTISEVLSGVDTSVLIVFSFFFFTATKMSTAGHVTVIAYAAKAVGVSGDECGTCKKDLYLSFNFLYDSSMLATKVLNWILRSRVMHGACSRARTAI